MILPSLDDFATEGIGGTFGILDIALEGDQKTLTDTFIENGKKKNKRSSSPNPGFTNASLTNECNYNF